MITILLRGECSDRFSRQALIDVSSPSVFAAVRSSSEHGRAVNCGGSEGFTLIEVIVVAAIAGVLGQVAIPQFLDFRVRAQARASTAAAVGIAKECAVLKVDDGGSSTVVDPSTGSLVTCDNLAVSEIMSEPWSSPQVVNCVGSVISVSQVTLRIEPTGEISCS